eukprot:g113.t1
MKKTLDKSAFVRLITEQGGKIRCFKCRLPISPDSDFLVKEDGHHFHKDCFRCVDCRQVIEGSHHVTTKDGRLHCASCALPHCDRCGQYITGAMVISPLDSDPSVEAHFHPGCFRCGKCGKVISGAVFHDGNDGHFCGDCANSGSGVPDVEPVLEVHPGIGAAAAGARADHDEPMIHAAAAADEGDENGDNSGEDGGRDGLTSDEIQVTPRVYGQVEVEDYPDRAAAGEPGRILPGFYLDSAYEEFVDVAEEKEEDGAELELPIQGRAGGPVIPLGGIFGDNGVGGNATPRPQDAPAGTPSRAKRASSVPISGGGDMTPQIPPLFATTSMIPRVLAMEGLREVEGKTQYWRCQAITWILMKS